MISFAGKFSSQARKGLVSLAAVLGAESELEVSKTGFMELNRTILPCEMKRRERHCFYGFLFVR